MSRNPHSKLVAAAALFKRRLASMRPFSRLQLLAMLEWHAARSSLATATDTATGRVVAAGCARPLRSAADHRDRYAWHDDGKVAWVDMTVAVKPDALRTLLVAARARFPNCDRIGFTRHKSGHRVRTYPISTFLQRAGLPA